MAGTEIRTIRLGRSPNCSSLGNIVNVLVWTQAVATALWVAAESWPVRRRRPEPDGGETRATDDPPALVRTGEGGGPVEAHVQITRACSLPCADCHISPTPDGAHVPLDTLRTRFQQLADRGVMHVAVGGGESLRHPDLPAIAEAAHAAGLTIGMTTSGIGPLERARGFDRVAVSMDSTGFQRSRGYDAAPALAAIRALGAGVNIVLSSEALAGLEQTVAAAVEAGARDVQLLRLKPVGRGAANYRPLTREERLSIWPRIQALIARHPTVDFRIDCAMVPFLAAHGVDPSTMKRFGILGCHGGDEVASVDTDGNVHPCSFTEGPWEQEVRAAPCDDCRWREVCRGGCHAVAKHVTGSLFAPDPECPMVDR